MTLLIFLLGCQPQPGTSVDPGPSPKIPPTVLGQREYVVHQHFSILNAGAGQPQKQDLWVALIRDFPPYQQVRSMKVTPASYTSVVDELDNRYAEFDFSGQTAGSTQTVDIEYRVVINELAYNLSTCQGKLPDIFVQPELHIESANPQIVSLANDLSRGKDTVCRQVRAFYDYIGNTLVYTFNGANWGAQTALGPMGADCTEYADLLVALSRAKGIPARYFEGLLYLENGPNDLARTEHAWADVYTPSAGWVAVDPTLGRLTVNRETYFAHATPDHIIVTVGASPSVLRGSSYWTHLYWPGNSTNIRVTGDWKIDPVNEGAH